jgi:hypothetical protein
MIPEYTLSLLFWIIPVAAMTVFFISKRSLAPVPRLAMLLNLCVLSAVGFVLDLFFARWFFTFPDPGMTLGISLRGIPVEEFVFYLSGFWFIIAFYVLNDEYFLAKYNVPDSRYLRYARRLRRKVYLTVSLRSLLTLVILCGSSIACKYLLNRSSGFPVPGYFIFLSIAAYVPWIFFWRISRLFVNTRALVFTIVTTLCISIIWEVTLALPRGYWGYNSGQMVGVFISFWTDLPIEAVTVWLFSSLIILSYEYTKVQLYRRQTIGKEMVTPED